jgi:hypothetical protein
LAAREHPDQGRIRFAEIFHDDPEDRVNDEEQTGDETIRGAETRPDDPEDDEEDQPFQKRFVKLRRMPWREDCPQRLCNLGIRPDRFDDRFNGAKRRINLLAGGKGAIGLRGVPPVE